MSAGIGNRAPRGSASDANRMPLMEHLRELRRRLVRSLIAIIIGAVAGWYFYDHIVHAMIDPVCQPGVKGVSTGRCGALVVTGVVGPFSLQMKVALFAGIAFASPVWLYQFWAFLAPGLHRHEKRWAYGIVGAGVPLFAFGAWLSYLILPTAVRVLLGLSPTDVHNQIPLDDYLNFVLRMLFVFGMSFELPLVIVMANLAGLVSARRVRSWWRGMTFGIFVFAAVATPTGDPGTMTVMATPMVFLYGCAIVITTFIDRRRARAAAQL
ncbi:MAG TPA: twin-arginine translocase subunit TatC [Sporichthyaceae bacterium]|jgi:sec-independent protein translocase protein TatC